LAGRLYFGLLFKYSYIDTYKCYVEINLLSNNSKYVKVKNDPCDTDAFPSDVKCIKFDCGMSLFIY